MYITTCFCTSNLQKGGRRRHLHRRKGAKGSNLLITIYTKLFTPCACSVAFKFDLLSTIVAVFLDEKFWIYCVSIVPDLTQLGSKW